jgi:hypothetical protein
MQFYRKSRKPTKVRKFRHKNDDSQCFANILVICLNSCLKVFIIKLFQANKFYIQILRIVSYRFVFLTNFV